MNRLSHQITKWFQNVTEVNQEYKQMKKGTRKPEDRQKVMERS